MGDGGVIKLEPYFSGHVGIIGALLTCLLASFESRNNNYKGRM